MPPNSKGAKEVIMFTVASWEGVAPPPVCLADGPVARPLKRHPLLAPEADDGVERGPRALEPAVRKDARRAAVDFWK